MTTKTTDRSVIVSVRWPSPDHLEEVERVAARLGESLSVFLRRSALERMQRHRKKATR
ncbi:MAG: hypothetical protein OES13_06530 [Acidimicrobiia bacterium]|nr:hypothetical protein [Acidimicrobiia bacterium]